MTLWDPKDCSTSGFPVLHHLLELTQTHVHWFSDAIQPSHSLSTPSPPAFNLAQHQGLFQWVSSSYQVARVLVLQLQHQSFQWIFRADFLYYWLVWLKGFSRLFSNTTVQKYQFFGAQPSLRPNCDVHGFPCGSAGKEFTCNVGELGSIPELGRSGKGYPLQYSGLENSMDCIVHGVTKSWTQLGIVHFWFLISTHDYCMVLTIQTFVSKVMSLLFNILSRFIISFLPRNKRLLISWLQSPSAVILDPKKIKSATVSILMHTPPPASTSICHEVRGPDGLSFFNVEF